MTGALHATHISPQDTFADSGPSLAGAGSTAGSAGDLRRRAVEAPCPSGGRPALGSGGGGAGAPEGDGGAACGEGPAPVEVPVVGLVWNIKCWGQNTKEERQTPRAVRDLVAKYEPDVVFMVELNPKTGAKPAGKTVSDHVSVTEVMSAMRTAGYKMVIGEPVGKGRNVNFPIVFYKVEWASGWTVSKVTDLVLRKMTAFASGQREPWAVKFTVRDGGGDPVTIVLVSVHLNPVKDLAVAQFKALLTELPGHDFVM